MVADGAVDPFQTYTPCIRAKFDLQNVKFYHGVKSITKRISEAIP